MEAFESNQDDAKTNFCMSLVQQVKRLDPQTQAVTRLCIQQLLFDAEFPTSSSPGMMGNSNSFQNFMQMPLPPPPPTPTPLKGNRGFNLQNPTHLAPSPNHAVHCNPQPMAKMARVTFTLSLKGLVACRMTAAFRINQCMMLCAIMPTTWTNVQISEHDM